MSQQRLTILIEAMNKSRAEFKDVETDLSALKSARLEVNRTVLEEARAHRTLSQVYRVQHMAYYDALGVMRSIGSIGNQLLGIWTAHNVAQIRVADSLRDVNTAQRIYNEALEFFGAESVVTEARYAELQETTERYKKAQDDAAKGVWGMSFAFVGVLGDLGMFALGLDRIISKYGGIAAILTGLKALAVGIAAPLAPLALGAAFVLAPALIATALATEEQKEAMRLEVYKQQSEAARIMRGGAIPGGYGAEDWIPSTGLVSAGIPEIPPITRPDINIYIDKVSSEVDLDSLERRLERAYNEAARGRE